MPIPKDKYDAEFRLHVKDIAEDVMSTRELTVKEVEVIKVAVSQSLELLVTKHIMACEQRRKEAMLKELKILSSIVVAISTIISVVVSICL